MQVRIKNINAWKSKTEAAKKRIKSKAGVYVQKKVTAVFNDILKVSPQWSGNFVYNWNIVTSQYKGYTYDSRFKVSPYWDLRGSEKQMGDREAINASLQWNNDVIKTIKWNSNVGVVNTHPMAEEIQSGNIPRPRPENMIPGHVSVVAYIKSKYKFVV